MLLNVLDQPDGVGHNLRLRADLTQGALDQGLNVRPRSVEVIFWRERDTLLVAVNVIAKHPRGRRFYPLASLFARSAVTFDELCAGHSDLHTGKCSVQQHGTNAQ